MLRYLLKQFIERMNLTQSFRPLQAVALLASLFIEFASAQSTETPSAVVAPAAPQAAAGSGSAQWGVSKLALSVTQLGAFRCVERADKLTKFLGRGASDIFIVDRPGQGPNVDLISVTMIVNQGGDNHSTIEINLAQTPTGCTASYVASVSATEPCEQSERKFYSGLAFKPVGSGAPHRIATIGNEARVLSRPVPGGCVLTKHEVIR